MSRAKSQFVNNSQLKCFYVVFETNFKLFCNGSRVKKLKIIIGKSNIIRKTILWSLNTKTLC